MESYGIANRLAQNLDEIHSEINNACLRTGRHPADIRLVAVTKYAEWPWVTALRATHRIFGENRPQQLAERQPLLPDVEWHLIGQLQRNKVRLAITHATLIHSVDSLRLLERIAIVARELGMQARVLLQVNESGEAAKSGFSPATLPVQWPEVVSFARAVKIEGLMTMAAASDDPEDARPAFRALRELRELLASRPDSQAAGLLLPQLSMGMSSDFVTAVEEGATLVRIGSRIFAGLS